MDLCLALKICYKQGISPFQLHSALLDVCKGNLALKEQAETLYKLCQQKNIFAEIANCTQTNLSNLLQSYDESMRDCLVSVARLLHPDWELPATNNGETKQIAKVQNGDVSIAQQVVEVPVQIQDIQPPKETICKNSESLNIEKQSIKITSLVSSLDVITSQTMEEFQVRVCQNGVWITCWDCISRRQNTICVNVENLVANKVEVLIPNGKYKALTINKVCGELRIIDTDDCFENISLDVSSGNVSCHTSAKHVQAKVKVGKVVLEYIALCNGTIKLNNDLGGVRISTFFVKNINGKITSQKGEVTNKHQAISGHDIHLDVKAKYSNVEVM